MATSMVIGDGILTPSISVLSAVGGIKNKSSSLGQGAVVWISIGILIILFAVQRFGTDKVGYAFAPIILVWFLLVGVIGLYNLLKYDISVLRALNPMYIVDYMKRNGKDGWLSLGGIFLCITGSEAMFADLGHFNVPAIQISFSFIAFPALICAYSGQTAYLRKFPSQIGNTFYNSIPDPIFWPTFVVAVSAAIIASQAMISGTYSIIQHSQSLGCFPRVKVVHTSTKHEGIAVCIVMLVTTGMVALIMLVIWKTRILWIALFVVIFGLIEIVYLSSMLTKFAEGGFLPLVLSLVLMSIMGIWHYTHRKMYLFELKNKVSGEYVRELVSKRVISRTPGVSLIFSELVEGVPPIFAHVISNISHIHAVVVFVSVKSIPISKVGLDEKFLFGQIQPKEDRIFRCVVRYGYNDVIGEPNEFEQQLIEQLKEFIRDQNVTSLIEGEEFDVKQTNSDNFVKDGKDPSNRIVPTSTSSNQGVDVSSTSSDSIHSYGIISIISNQNLQGVEEEISFVQREMEKNVVYMLGEAEVVAEPNSSILKKIVVNHIYNFLRRNIRQGENLMAFPRSRLLKIGMTYEI
ncbi:potassium transporter 5-like isoform X2 [Trifolium pratense]|uniref:potassium transporter 5-like isoform X2 n=1 Tax=Trifolium pratense TaxID=57577 RepID=UPI001E6944DF|nr:potassium transporter 5-like isoform X2 [Trifolium pratense]